MKQSQSVPLNNLRIHSHRPKTRTRKRIFSLICVADRCKQQIELCQYTMWKWNRFRNRFPAVWMTLTQNDWTLKQECIPVGCVPPAAVAVGREVSTRHPQDHAPLWDHAPPGTMHPHPPDQAPPGPCTPPGTMHPLDHAPLLGPCTHQDHAPPGPCTPRPYTPFPPDHAPPRDHVPSSPCGQTHACKHITLPQTLFGGGKNRQPLNNYLQTSYKWLLFL